MDRIYELQDEPLSSNTTAGSVDIVSSFNEIVVVTPRPIVNLNLQPHEYPKRDEKFNERLETYPPTFSQVCPVAADRLALAGFRFVGIESAPDMVQCDYCYGRLQRWELSDDPLHEHLRHYSTCDFLLPLKQATKNPQWSLYETRLDSFNGEYWTNRLLPPTQTQLAEAGFYFVGGLEMYQNVQAQNNPNQQNPTYRPDATKCFHCDTTLHSWEDEDDVWVEHAKWSGKCGYLIAKRGLDFVMRHSQVRNFPDELAMRLGMGRTSDRCEPCRNVPHDPQITTAQIKTADLKRESDRLPEPTRPEEINQCFDNLLKTVQCKVCLTARSSILFLPCSHISVCPECARQLPEDKCPICRETIVHRIDAFIS